MNIGNYELNKIYNEDSYKAIKNIPDNSIDLIVTDPPYLIDDCGGGGCFGTKQRNYHHDVTENDDINCGINNYVLDEFVRVLKKINIYIWCNKNQLRQYIDYFDNIGCNVDLLKWHKTNPVPTCNNKYLSDTEYCLYFREAGVGLYGTYETKKKFYVTSTNKEDKELYNHPTIKPLDIIKNLVLNSSSEGQVVLDTFMGSGTTAVACVETNRRFIGFEINPEYYKVSCDRLNGITVQETKAKENGLIDIFDFIGDKI